MELVKSRPTIPPRFLLTFGKLRRDRFPLGFTVREARLADRGASVVVPVDVELDDTFGWPERLVFSRPIAWVGNETHDEVVSELSMNGRWTI